MEVCMEQSGRKEKVGVPRQALSAPASWVRTKRTAKITQQTRESITNDCNDWTVHFAIS